jgi:type II secretory pathway component GspD/PulD (secretin)
MNNQPAMIKIGTDRTFFTRSVTTDTSAAGSTSLIEDIPSVVTEGIVMALTPQISASGWIMMDISPIITRVASVERVLDSNGNTTASAPNLDIRQTSSLVRMENGNTIVIGGLIQTTQSTTTRKVPGAGNIPLIGKLFGGEYKVQRKKELLIFLTADLVDTASPEFALSQN